ncbi:MAG: response regulator transcription factor [Bdellovibrionaceae bacterium]|jgi:two-component system, LytTR family, response regulator|nr:response regulator transcription factor [Pseudobdellovibrionaceae bacterium]
MLRALIVDDEKPARERLIRLLQDYPDIMVVDQAKDGVEALDKIEQYCPDVVFLDVEMPELNGIEVARTLGIKAPLIIFITAYDEFALQAFETNTIDYIVKPINSKRFEVTINKVRNLFSKKKKQNINGLIEDVETSKKNNKFVIKVGNKYEILNTQKISAVMAKDHYSAIIVGNKEFLCDDSLDKIINRLDSSVFMRSHRSAVLNTDFILSLKREGDRKFVAILSDEQQTKVPISRERLSEIKKILHI